MFPIFQLNFRIRKRERECELQGQIAQTVDRRLSCSVNQLPVSKLGLLAVIQSFPHFNPF